MRTLPISTTNITGLRAIRRGSSLTTEPVDGLPDDGAVEQRPGLLRGLVLVCDSGGVVHGGVSSEAQLLDDGAEGEDGEVGQADDDQDDADEQAGEQRRAGGERAGRGGAGCLRASEPAMASAGTMSRKRPTSIDRPSVVLYQSVLPVRPPKAEPLLLPAEVKA